MMLLVSDKEGSAVLDIFIEYIFNTGVEKKKSEAFTDKVQLLYSLWGGSYLVTLTYCKNNVRLNISIIVKTCTQENYT